MGTNVEHQERRQPGSNERHCAGKNFDWSTRTEPGGWNHGAIYKNSRSRRSEEHARDRFPENSITAGHARRRPANPRSLIFGINAGQALAGRPVGNVGGLSSTDSLGNIFPGGEQQLCKSRAEGFRPANTEPPDLGATGDIEGPPLTSRGRSRQFSGSNRGRTADWICVAASRGESGHSPASSSEALEAIAAAMNRSGG